jgi:hypothetical protein
VVFGKHTEVVDRNIIMDNHKQIFEIGMADEPLIEIGGMKVKKVPRGLRIFAYRGGPQDTNAQRTDPVLTMCLEMFHDKHQVPLRKVQIST